MFFTVEVTAASTIAVSSFESTMPADFTSPTDSTPPSASNSPNPTAAETNCSRKSPVVPSITRERSASALSLPSVTRFAAMPEATLRICRSRASASDAVPAAIAEIDPIAAAMTMTSTRNATTAGMTNRERSPAFASSDS